MGYKFRPLNAKREIYGSQQTDPKISLCILGRMTGFLAERKQPLSSVQAGLLTLGSSY
jgi:hypothetical protein